MGSSRRNKPAYARHLTPHWDRNGWKKKYKNKQRYFRGPITREGYQLALEEFERKKPQFDLEHESHKPNRDQYELALRLRQLMVDWCSLERNRLESGGDFDSCVEEFRRTHRQPTEDHKDTSPTATYEFSVVENPTDEQQAESKVTEDFLTGLCTFVGISIEEFDVEPTDDHPSITVDDLIEWERLRKLDYVTKTHRRLQGEIKKLRSLFTRVAPPKLNAPDTLPDHPLEGEDDAIVIEWTRNIEFLQHHRQLTSTAEYPDTIAGNIDEYLKHKRCEVESGQISASWYQSLDYRLKHFIDFTGSHSVVDLNEQTLSSFRNHLQQRVGESDPKKTMSQHYARNIITSTKSFVRWLYQQHVIENRPRNLDKLTIKIDAREIETFSRDEIDRILGAFKDRLKLYILLMLNCGYYQSDIANLKHGEVDWNAGRIHRKRSKSSHHENSPTVNYPLWDETFRLLSESQSTDSEFVLLNANGKPLVRREFQSNGKVSNVDSIKTAYAYACKKSEIETKPLMLLRKTSATKLGEHAVFGRFAQHFLGHAPESLADKRYAKPSSDQFDKAVIYLGEQFNFKTDTERLGLSRAKGE